jgi:hypothetical protein
LPSSARERRRLGRRLGAPYLVPLGLAAAAAAGAWLLRDRISAIGRFPAGGERQVRDALANQVRAHLEDVYGFRAGGTLELSPVRYAEVSAVVEGGEATVVALLEVEGRAAWRDQAAAVSYIGRERFKMRPCAIAGWCAEGEQFQRLRGLLLALFRRHDALAAAALPARRRVLAWQIRAERDTAEVGEDRETVSASGAPVRERSRFTLRFDGTRWAGEG